MRLTDFRVPATDFEWGFEARLPDRPPRPAPGAPCGWSTSTRSTATRCGASSTCSSGTPRGRTWPRPPATPPAPRRRTPAGTTRPPFDRTGFHRWAVRKETSERGITLSYLYDDRVYATDTCEDRLAATTCSAVLDRGWTAILQTAVFADESGPFTQPADTLPFPAQELVVRDMWVAAL